MNSDIKIWQERINRAEGLQQEQHDDWKNSIDLYNCSFFDKMKGGTDPEFVAVNFARWYVDKLIPLVYFRDPFIFVKARSDKYGEFADTLEEVINYEWKRLRLKKQFKRVILSTCLTPPGWIKLGYTAKIGQDVAKLEEIKQKGLIDEIKNTIKGVFRKEPEQASPEEQGILNAYITEENLFASWIPSWNMLMPEGYQVIEEMPYLIEIEDLPKLDFMNNPFYVNKKNISIKRDLRGKYSEKEELTTPGYTGKSFTGSSGWGGDSEQDIIRLYHIWDRREQKRMTISNQEMNDYHFRGKWCYDIEGFPYKPLMLEDNLPQKNKSNPYPINILKSVMPQIVEKSLARTHMAKWRKRAGAYILAQEGLATDEDLNQLTQTEALQVIKVSNIGAFQMSQSPALPAQIFEIDEIIDQDLQMGTSMGQMMFQAQPGQRTATQASIGQGGLQAKMSANVDCIEDFTVEVATSLAQLAWQFYDRDKVEEIVGEKVTEKMWLDLPSDPEERRRLIRSEIQFRIDAGSTAPPKDETVDKKQLLDLASIIMTIAPERIKKGEFAERLLKKFKFAKDLNKVVISSDDDEQKKAQLENQLMVQGHPQIVGPNEPHDIHIQEHVKAAGNELVDKHIVEHGQRMGIMGKGSKGNQDAQQGGAQSGDTRPPLQSTNPEINRQGSPSSASIKSGASNLGPGTTGKVV